MVEANSTVAMRLWRKGGRWLLALIFLVTFTNWLPVAAQDPSQPTTVVLPAVQTRLPMIIGESPTALACPTTSHTSFESIQILGNPRNPERAPSQDPDLNLTVRGFKRITALLSLVAINGPTDEDAPQLAYLFRPVRVPDLHANYQVNDWNWACCPGGKVGEPITEPEVTLVEMVTTPGEAIYPPRRNKHVGGDHIAMVLYADTYRITFTYTREDSPAFGYLVHIENLCVDPNLLALYLEMNTAGRDELPALRIQDSIGSAPSTSVMVAVRDTGSFMDPRSGKDWWQDRVRAILAAQTR